MCACKKVFLDVFCFFMQMFIDEWMIIVSKGASFVFHKIKNIRIGKLKNI